MSETGGGPEYGDFYQKLVEGQTARKASIEQRGLAVITTSGTLATLLFGLVALLSKPTAFELPTQARGPLVAALVAFVVSALFALLTNVPLNYENVVVEDPETEVRQLWQDTQEEARIALTVTRVKIFKRARTLNERKAWLLLLAMLAEFVAIIAVAIAVGEVLRHG
jgi:hypothetical protein